MGSQQMTLTRKSRPRKAKAVKADTMDRRLLALLSEDALQRSTTLAKKLNVSAATVRRRLKKLVRSGVLHVVGVADPALIGLPLSVVLALDVAGGKSESVMEELNRRPEIGWLSATTGQFDVIAIARLPSADSLYDFMTNGLTHIEGVRGIQSFVCLDGENGHHFLVTR